MTPFDKDHAPPAQLHVRGKDRTFDVDDPKLPKWVKDHHFASGGYPYTEKLGKHTYKDALYALQVELVKLQYWQQSSGKRVVVVFEGRDSAGKGGTIRTMRETLNPRQARVVALPKPSDRERGEWYFQRYATHLPTAGEMVLFDRSWYNRAGVEPVMGFCSAEQHKTFLREAPAFEASLTRDGIVLIKYWLAIGREMQLKRFHDRRHDPRKIWKLSPMDIAALDKWQQYTNARDQMLKATHTVNAPWTVVRMNDKKRGRINLIADLLSRIDYDNKDKDAIPTIDPDIVIDGTQYKED
ncbi:MAG: polyphosphate kinase 2 [Pseudomonadota bacterium]